MSATVGMIGVGIMGRGMALNLLKSGRQLVVWNRTPSKCDELKAHGATVVANPADVVEQAGVTYSMLSTPEAAKAVFFAERGTLAGVRPGKSLVDCATLDPATMEAFASAVSSKGGRFLEAPVSGSKAQAEGGVLIMICAGDRSLYDDIEGNDLKAMGKASFFLGDVGAGSKMKLAVNMVMGEMLCALGEGIHLADRAALNPSTLVEILGLGAMACPLVAGKGPAMAAGGPFPTAFPLKHQLKDVCLACDLGASVSAELPLAAAASGHFAAALDQHGDEDFSSVVKVINAKAQA